MLRIDNGKENVYMAVMQSFLRSEGDDDFAGCNAHRYGSSPENQPKEAGGHFLEKVDPICG